MASIAPTPYNSREIIFKDFDFSALTHSFIFTNCSSMPDSAASNFFAVQPNMIAINIGRFNNPGSTMVFPAVLVQYQQGNLILDCGCNYSGVKMCDHQAQVLYNIMERADLRIFFDVALRHKKIRIIAKSYGLENEPNPDADFELVFHNNLTTIKPRNKALLSINETGLQLLARELVPQNNLPVLTDIKSATTQILVFSQHKYFNQLAIGIFEAATSLTGKIKNPLKNIDPLELVWKTNVADEVKFFTGIATLLQQPVKVSETADLKALTAIVKNPKGLATFYHDTGIADNISAISLVPVQLCFLQTNIKLQVYLKDACFEISGQITLNDKIYTLDIVPIKYGFFILAGGKLQLIGDPDMLRVITFFKKHHNNVLIHQSKFEEFRKTILAKLEDKISISYAWLVAATQQQLQDNAFDETPQPIIYLSDAGNHVMINPVMRYGDAEVSIISKRQLFARDQKGKQFIVERDDRSEINFTGLLLQQHAEFAEQLHQEAFYLTKEQFLETGWFLNAFEKWRANGIQILGFNEIKNNKLNSHKATVSIKVTSGLDWFNTDLDVRYGKQKASLKQLYKSVKNGNQYVTLDDGTLGILPVEWIKKMAAFFEAGEIAVDSIHTPFINFTSIAMLYDKELLSETAVDKINFYSNKLANFKAIENVLPPATLKTTLRHYQQEGLNWLNFLDDMGFGGCLADDMGLGKTIQILAFILLLKTKRIGATHLIVVPTSIIFNWQAELQKFAPSLTLLTIHGNNNPKNNHHFNDFDIVLTSYGMLISNIHYLKSFRFDYIFLDESQAIKNPDSQRYKAVRLLHSYNKILLTGTPIENNTYDLYGQLSFACPGLLGSKQYFKDIYAQPIDKFHNSERAAALQQKIDPFILRRTKKQVATELPDKTEMIIYCEMGLEQRKVYDAYESEFRAYLLHKQQDELFRERMHVLQGLTKLRQICDSPSLLKDQPFYGDASAKIEVLTEQIESKSKHHKILVFSQFVGMLNLISKALTEKYIAFEYLTGQTKNRAAVVESFQNNQNIRVFLISLKAGGTGLNLTEADYVYIIDPWWNPAVENQAIDRCYRIGQQKHVVAVRLICPYTIEEKIMKLQATKNNLVNDLIKTDSNGLKQFSKKDLLSLLNATGELPV